MQKSIKRCVTCQTNRAEDECQLYTHQNCKLFLIVDASEVAVQCTTDMLDAAYKIQLLCIKAISGII